MQTPCARAVFGVVLALATPDAWARAQDRPLAEALIVSDADACLTSRELASSACAWLGRSHVDRALSIRVAVGRQGRAADVALLRGEEVLGLRRFDELPAECSDRRALLGLAIALAIDATLLDARAHALANVPNRATLPSRPGRFGGGSVAIELGAEAGIAVGLPTSATGAALIGLRIADLARIELGALGTSVVSVPVGPGHADVMRVGGRAQACLLVGLAPFEVAGCLGLIAGAALAAGRGFRRDREAEIPWVAAVSRLELAVAVADPLAIGLAVDGMLATVRPRLEVLGPDGVVSASQGLPAAGFALALGLRARFR